MTDDTKLPTPADTTKEPVVSPKQPVETAANATVAEIGGPSGPEPTRYGDWESGGRCSDF
jgi:hypothetical protein